MPNIRLILLIGQYAQHYYLPKNPYNSLTETVQHYEDFLDKFWVLPHPSPRNGIWLKKNEWFEQHTIPRLQDSIHQLTYKKL
jgi:uracil-DNA glycosylase